MIIGLGTDCGIRYNLNKYFEYNNATHFFDYVNTNFKTILHILSDKFDYNTELTKEKFNYTNATNSDFNRKCHIIVAKNFYFKSVHDALITLNANESIDLVVDKYRRRYIRLIETIKSDNDIIFISAIDSFDSRNIVNRNIKEDDFILFFNYLNHHNPNNNFKLIIITDHDIAISDPILNNKLFIFKACRDNWQRNNFDWNKLKNFIILQKK